MDDIQGNVALHRLKDAMDPAFRKAVAHKAGFGRFERLNLLFLLLPQIGCAAEVHGRLERATEDVYIYVSVNQSIFRPEGK